MRKIVYYVAMSLDGYIAGEGGDIGQFILEGKGVEKYMNDLTKYDTVLMGRNTYEFGYNYGLKAGEPAYPNMIHHIFSNSLTFDEKHESVFAEKMDVSRVREIKAKQGSDIYLCGGGEFAGWLLDHKMIDELKIKLNPIVLGSGIRLFGSSKTLAGFGLKSSEKFEDGLQILTYAFG